MRRPGARQWSRAMLTFAVVVMVAWPRPAPAARRGISPEPGVSGVLGRRRLTGEESLEIGLGGHRHRFHVTDAAQPVAIAGGVVSRRGAMAAGDDLGVQLSYPVGLPIDELGRDVVIPDVVDAVHPEEPVL